MRTIPVSDELYAELEQISKVKGRPVMYVAASLLKQALADTKATDPAMFFTRSEPAANIVLHHFGEYNPKRYSKPWVCRVTGNGELNFADTAGVYTSNHGEAGDLIVFAPQMGAVYAYGQKDYRLPKATWMKFARWTGQYFVPCGRYESTLLD